MSKVPSIKCFQCLTFAHALCPCLRLKWGALFYEHNCFVLSVALIYRASRLIRNASLLPTLYQAVYVSLRPLLRVRGLAFYGYVVQVFVYYVRFAVVGYLEGEYL